MKRSQFIKSSCTACAMFALPGIATMLLDSCVSLPSAKVEPDYTTKTCLVPLSKFQESKLVLLRIKNFEFDFLVIKKSESAFKTLELRCTHEAQPLTMSNKNIYCASHGSIFDFEGNSLKEPAHLPLKSLKTEINSTHLIIHLP